MGKQKEKPNSNDAIRLARELVDRAEKDRNPMILLFIDEGNQLRIVSNIPADMAEHVTKILSHAQASIAQKFGN
jgi:hypothetical protein